MKKKLDISGMCSRLRADSTDVYEPVNTTDLRPSPDRIKALAMEKLSHQVGQHSPERRNKPVNRISMKLLVAAALVCLVSVTAFAAFGGLEYFQSIFGGSADSVKDNITTPMISVQNADYRMAVEAVLSDGYKTNLVLSLEQLGKKEIPDSTPSAERDPVHFFSADFPKEDFMCASSVTMLDEFSTAKKQFFRVEVNTQERHAESELVIALDEALGGDSVQFIPEGSLAMRSVEIDPAHTEGKNYRLESVRLSPLGALVIGSEQEAKGGLPILVIRAKLRDGSYEEIMPDWAFDPGDSDDESTVMGGGGAVIAGPGEKLPLVVTAHGSRNPGGKVITESSFSRLLNLDDVVSIVVDKTEYPLGK